MEPAALKLLAVRLKINQLCSEGRLTKEETDKIQSNLRAAMDVGMDAASKFALRSIKAIASEFV